MTTRESLAVRTDELADQMEMLAVDYDYFGGLNPEMKRKSVELMGASQIARKWAEQMRGEA